MNKRAVLLVNLGSPDSASVKDVRTYLGEFLMDGRVLDVAYPIRWGIVHFAILPKRPIQSAEAYEKIWTPEGSPLVTTSRKVRELLEEQSGIRVELAMRYRNPSIREAICRLREEGYEEVLLIPLFPHYAMSSYETAVVRVRELMAEVAPHISLSVAPPYYQHPDYIQALAGSAAEYLKQDYDHLLFSFHGIPERHLHKTDPTGGHRQMRKDCSDGGCPTEETCYRAQCYKTAQEFVRAAGIPSGKYSVGFQSRLGRDPWLQPYTDYLIDGLAKAGTKKLLVICPSFVSDCLETIEEIGLRGRESFLAAGGKELTLIPCLNEHPLWINALESMVSDWAGSSMARASVDNRMTAQINAFEL